MLTVEMLKAMPENTVFAKGTCKNSPDDIYMTDNNIGQEMKWFAQRGHMHDWAIYIHWAYHSDEYIMSNGDKVRESRNIQKLVPCEQDALNLYRG